MKNISKAAILATMLLAIAGCKKDTEDPPTSTSTTETAVDATVRMHFNFLNVEDPFTLNDTEIQDSLGHAVKLDQVRFFVSGTHAFDDEGNVLAHYEDAYMLVDAAQADTIFDIGAIHASHIHQFHFDLGLDQMANSVIPDLSPAPMNDSTMWFNATMGHKFLVVTGHANLDGNGFNTPVNYMCGMDMLLTEAHAHVHHDLTEGEVFTAQVDVNLALLFKGIDLSVDSMPMMASPASQRAMSNLSLGIDGEE